MGVGRSPSPADEPCGIVAVNKPSGLTSHGVVARLRRVFGTRRVGHTGTLDPLATGVLPVCVGRATRVAEYVAAGRKEYVATFVFGITTNTEDVTGAATGTTDASAVTRERIEEALAAFVGDIQQVPPMVSAVHHQGARLYELARAGIVVERAPRPVTVHAIAVESFSPGPLARARVRVECSSGTYIRTLAADAGRALGVGGAMETLERTRVGPFALADALPLDDLQAMRDRGEERAALVPIETALADWPRLALSADDLVRITRGQAVTIPPGLAEDGTLVLLLGDDGRAAAIARKQGAFAHPSRVFLPPPEAHGEED